MTYNATYRILFQLTDTEQLILRKPRRPVNHKRWIYLTPAIHRILDGDDDAFSYLPTYETETLIGRFSAGHLVTASLEGNSDLQPDIEKLIDLDEVWVLCARRPRLAWKQARLLGRFLDRSIFIGTGFYDRAFMGTRERYHEFASDVPRQWNDLFGETDPYRAKSVEDYLGGVWRDVDEKNDD